MEFDEFSAMNTVVQVAADGDPERLRQGFERVRSFVARSEQRFSRFRETSELSQLNHSAGHWFHASPEMFDLVEQALQLHAMTDGLFNPSVLKALQRFGYEHSMDEVREAELPKVADAPWIVPPFDKTRLDPDTCGICLPAGIQIDLGGIAKGWIAARAAELLLPFTQACAVSAGGDMALLGLPARDGAWEISLEDPLDTERVLAVLRIPPGGLATSTVTRRRWLQGDRPRHHIIDPRSGQPSASPWLSVTAYAESPVLVEAFASALLIAGPSQAPALISHADGLQFLAVDQHGELTGTLENVEMLHVPEQ